MLRNGASPAGKGAADPLEAVGIRIEPFPPLLIPSLHFRIFRCSCRCPSFVLLNFLCPRHRPQCYHHPHFPHRCHCGRRCRRPRICRSVPPEAYYGVISILPLTSTRTSISSSTLPMRQYPWNAFCCCSGGVLNSILTYYSHCRKILPSPFRHRCHLRRCCRRRCCTCDNLGRLLRYGLSI